MPLSASNLTSLPEWQVIAEYLNNYITDYNQEILELAKRGNTAEIIERAGRISACKDILGLPEWLFTNRKEE